jgi:hypothetical protein
MNRKTRDGLPASRVFSRLGILLWSSDGEWSRGRKVRSRARETRGARSPREPRPENLTGRLSPVRFPRAGSQGRAPPRIRGDIQQAPAGGSQRGGVPPRDFRSGSRRAALPREIFRPGSARNPLGSAPRRPGVAVIAALPPLREPSTSGARFSGRECPQTPCVMMFGSV